MSTATLFRASVPSCHAQRPQETAPIAVAAPWPPGRRPAAAARRRCRRLPPPPAALFGFGGSKEPAAAAPPKAPTPVPEASGPLLIPYTPISKSDDYALRLFSAYPVAETVYERRDEGFLSLGGYMSGKNAAEARCRETQPVVMCYPVEGPKRMRIYIVPRGGSGGEAGALPPAPTDPSVSLTIAGGEVVAVRRFEGNATQEACERCRAALVAALQRDGLPLAEAEAGGEMVKPLMPSLVPPHRLPYEKPAPSTLEEAMAALVIVFQAPRRLARGAYRVALQETGYDEMTPEAPTPPPSKPASEASSDVSKAAAEGQRSPSSVLFATPLSKVAQQVRRRLLGGAPSEDNTAEGEGAAAAASDSESVASHPLAAAAAAAGVAPAAAPAAAPSPRAARKALVVGAAVALAAAAAAGVASTSHRRRSRSPSRRRVDGSRFPEPREVPYGAPKPAATVAAK
ncbi:SOUL heme-binding [Micractinium conductrix]|uniref:SOUL heme-binding n=1 Tax=Micractinium conductrix TaxID=554055 RepID=A0A2P6V6Y7_9CHLO|nr:SOUL heme-binding [Micractinium conductrix]|eukprot:PSC69851.1 SOUL heme-binding [Micractinium conductrix]